MPSPIEILLDPISLTALAIYAALMLWERSAPGRDLPDIPGWRVRGVAGGTRVGVLAYELAVYVWHRAMHGSPLLWRSFHQMHHSAERVDTYGAFYFSPLGMAGWTLLGSLALTLGMAWRPRPRRPFC